MIEPECEDLLFNFIMMVSLGLNMVGLIAYFSGFFAWRTMAKNYPYVPMPDLTEMESQLKEMKLEVDDLKKKVYKKGKPTRKDGGPYL